MNQKQESVESSQDLPPRTMLQELGGVMQSTTLDVTHALKSYLEIPRCCWLGETWRSSSRSVWVRGMTRLVAGT